MSPSPPPIIGEPTATAPAEPEIFCPACAYDLRGIMSDRCPECGLAIDRSAAAAISQIPWTHRRNIGNVRAYSRTLWRATLNPKRIGQECVRPVAPSDAKRFQQMTVLFAAFWVIAVFIGGMIREKGTSFLFFLRPAGYSVSNVESPFPGYFDLAATWEAGASLYPVMPVAILIAIALLPGAGRSFFAASAAPHVRRARATVLSRYACAPLAFLIIPALGAAGLLIVVPRDGSDPRGALESAATISGFFLSIGLVLILIAFYRSTLSILRHAAGASTGRIIAAAALLPLLWSLRIGLVLVIFPCIVGFIRLIYISLN